MDSLKTAGEKERVMHVSNTISPELLSHFFRMVADGAIIESDVKKFMQEPTLWRKVEAILSPDTAQAFWQGVYDELGIKVAVPVRPFLTDTQWMSLDKFDFLLVYIPAITEEQYPECFVKPDWDKRLDASVIERKLLVGRWVAVETVAKLDWDVGGVYPDDRLMAAVKRLVRFKTSHDDLTGGLLVEIAKATGFPKKGTRLPTAEEWNLIGNLFNWLREHRDMALPDLGSTNSWEWCENACGSGSRLIVGDSGDGGLAGVSDGWHDEHFGNVAFRVLAVL